MDHKEQRGRRKARNPFPESNRLLQQLRILSRAMVPFLAASARESLWHVRSRLSGARARLGRAAEKVRVPAPVYVAGSVAICGVAVFFSLYTLGTTVEVH